MTYELTTTAAIALANQAAAAPALDAVLGWLAQNAMTLAASAAFGLVGGGVIAAIAAKFIRNSITPPPPAPLDTPVPAADYWEFVYGAVKEAESKGDTGAKRMAHYMDAVDVFLDAAGIQGDARRIHVQRLKADAEFALRSLGFNQGTPKALPVAS
ncbi:hypothetical protein D3C72_780890 [compost metagenome]